jgi:hypothetical protein
VLCQRVLMDGLRQFGRRVAQVDHITAAGADGFAPLGDQRGACVGDKGRARGRVAGGAVCVDKLPAQKTESSWPPALVCPLGASSILTTLHLFFSGPRNKYVQESSKNSPDALSWSESQCSPD